MKRRLTPESLVSQCDLPFADCLVPEWRLKLVKKTKKPDISYGHMVGVGWGGDAHYYYWAQVMLTVLAD